MKYIYIINGRADKTPHYKDFYAQLKEIPHAYVVYTTLGEGDATRYVRLYCDLHPEEEVCFVACGGNGIINGVASGLVGYATSSEEAALLCANKTMAILYFGGATQDIIVNFPGRDFKSVRDMLDGTVTPTDIIQVNDSFCLNVCNLGFNSTVASRANELVAEGKSAHQAYTRGVINAFLTSRFNRIKTDGALHRGQWTARGRRIQLCPGCEAGRRPHGRVLLPGHEPSAAPAAVPPVPERNAYRQPGRREQSPLSAGPRSDHQQ